MLQYQAPECRGKCVRLTDVDGFAAQPIETLWQLHIDCQLDPAVPQPLNKSHPHLLSSHH